MTKPRLLTFLVIAVGATGVLHCGDDAAPPEVAPQAEGGSPDGGGDAAADAATEPLGPTWMVIDFGSESAAFPPTVNKIGFNSFWNSTSNDDGLDAFTIARGARYRAPMIGALIEPKSLVDVDGFTDSYEEFAGQNTTSAVLDAQSCTLWDQGTGYTSTLFYDASGTVRARAPSDPDLLAIRELVRQSGLVSLLQISGTPGTKQPSTTTLNNGLFDLVGTPTTGGNWYPLPAQADYPKLAYAFGTLAPALGYGTPTIWAFWQEPSHTLSEAITSSTSIDRYTKLYAQIATEITKQCSRGRCPMAGAQLNSNDGDHEPIDGYRYKWFVDGLRQARSATPTVAMPLDYFTIQSYSAQWNENIMRNARVALGTDSSWTPVLFNEWDYCVNTRAGDGCGPEIAQFPERYDGPLAWNALRWLEDTVDRPDVSHVLLREKVLKELDKKTGTYFYPWTQVPILFRASMSEMRRPTSYAIPELAVVASGDSEQLGVLAWNEGTTPKALPLSFVNVPTALVGKTLSVKRISKAIRDARCPGADVMDASHGVTCWEDAAAPLPLAADMNLPPIEVAAGEAVMVFAGAPPAYGSTTFASGYVRSLQHVDRDGSDAPPKGAGHYDPRTGSLTVGAKAGGAAAARVVLSQAPSTIVLRTRVAAQGGLAKASAFAGVRVDFLNDAGAVARSVFFRDDRWPARDVPWATFDWASAADVVVKLTNLCGATCAGGEGADVTLDLAAVAPASWSSAKEIDVGVVLAGSDGDAVYRVDLP